MQDFILVVEDSATQAERLRVLLEEEGYRVAIAGNGSLGLAHIHQDRPDLVISDVLMPELDGFSFCHALKAEAATRDIPIVLLTTENSPLDVIVGLERGADNFITKPYEDEYLLRAVRQILNDVHLRREGGLESDNVLHIGNRAISIPKNRRQIVELLASLTETGAAESQPVESQNQIAEYHTRIDQFERIQRALDDERFTQYYQPILDIRGNTVVKYEVLLRMLGKNNRIVLPSEFLPSAESSGLVSRIDLLVLHQSIKFLQEQHQQGRHLHLAINISGKSLLRPSVVERMADTIALMDIDPSYLTIEITETAVIDNMQQAIRALDILRDRGCRFALDDFGAGYAGLDYLKHLPVSFVKIDGSFVRDLPQKETDRKLVRAMTALAHDLDKQVVAEHCQDEETLDLLRQLDVDFAQGYHIGRPAPASSLWSP